MLYINSLNHINQTSKQVVQLKSNLIEKVINLKNISSNVVDNNQDDNLKLFVPTKEVLSDISASKNYENGYYIIKKALLTNLFQKDFVDENFVGFSANYLRSNEKELGEDVNKFFDEGRADEAISTGKIIFEKQGWNLISYIPLKNSTGRNIGCFIYKNNYSNLNDEIIKELVKWFFVVSVVFTLLNLSLLFYIRKTIIKPMKLATYYADEMAKGNFDVFGDDK